MTEDEEIVCDFSSELHKNRHVSDRTFERAGKNLLGKHFAGTEWDGHLKLAQGARHPGPHYIDGRIDPRAPVDAAPASDSISKMKRCVMKSTRVVGVALALLSIVGSYTYANETDDAKEFSAHLSGFSEAPLAILSPGTGTLQLSINTAAATINYTLSYSGLTAPATQSHIHFGKKHNTGGVIAFLCSNLSNPPAGTPACPQFEGTVSGTITAGQVIGQEPQNFPAGDFDALVAAIASETSYANVHTTKFPAGEIRGQIRDISRGAHHGER